MVYSEKITALLDANVLYPAPLRDYLLQLANLDLFTPKWTDEIQREWIDNLLLKRVDLSRDKLDKTKDAMNAAFPDANVINYGKLKAGLTLKDENDRHVLAAAIKAKANAIVTFNLKDFPVTHLKTFSIRPQHPDEFVTEIIRINKSKALEALNNQVKSLRNPPKTKNDILEALKACGLSASAHLLTE